MLTYSQYLLFGGLALAFLGFAAYLWAFVKSQSAQASVVEAPARVRVGAAGAAHPEPAPAVVSPALASARAWAQWGTHFTRLSLLLLLGSLTLRTLVTHHGPFANQYEFAVSFGFGIVAAYVFFEWRYHMRTLGIVVLPIAVAMLLYATTESATANPLVPALQNSLLLSVHVVVAIFAYGAFAVSFGAALLYLISPPEGRPGLPKPEALDRIGYKAVIIGWPLLTMVVVLGAVWAQIAWGAYWSWDPKETASLVTWLIYGGYLHARVTHGWVGKKAAWLLVLGFASVIFTFLGNLFFGGLHSYGRM